MKKKLIITIKNINILLHHNYFTTLRVEAYTKFKRNYCIFIFMLYICYHINSILLRNKAFKQKEEQLFNFYDTFLYQKYFTTVRVDAVKLIAFLVLCFDLTLFDSMVAKEFASFILLLHFIYNLSKIIEFNVCSHNLSQVFLNTKFNIKVMTLFKYISCSFRLKPMISIVSKCIG